MTLANACHMGRSVQLLCTGTALLSERRLCVVGYSLSGAWFRPPACFTEKMVLFVLLLKKDPLHYSIGNVPYKKQASSQGSWGLAPPIPIVGALLAVKNDLGPQLEISWGFPGPQLP